MVNYKTQKKTKLLAGILAMILTVNVSSCSNPDGTEGFEAGSHLFEELLAGPNHDEPLPSRPSSQGNLRQKRAITKEETRAADPSGAKAGAPIVGNPGDSRAGQPAH